MLTYTTFDSNNRAAGISGNPLEGSLGPVNVGEIERYGSMIGGAALAAAGLSRRSLPGLLIAALGGLLIARGIGGHCRLYQTIGVSTAAEDRPGVPHGTGLKIEKTILIGRPPEELFRFWRNLENLPEFMENIESIQVLDDCHSHWVVRGPGGQTVEWDAEIINEHSGEMISWQSLPGSDVQSAGTVRFTPADGGASTLLRVILEFHPPAGALGARIAELFGKDPSSQVDQDLIRLKEIVEKRPAANVAG